MNTKTKILVALAVILLIAGGIAFAQSAGNGDQKPPFNQGQNYPGPCGGGYGGACYGGGACGRW
jgi:uncharacterized membrane protein